MVLSNIMSLPQPQRIHSGPTYSQGGAVFNGDLHAARDINIHHITTIRPLARSLYRSCLTSAELFKQVQNELGALLAVLEATEDTSTDLRVDANLHPTLRAVAENCHQVLQDFQDLKAHFDSVGTQSQLTWERMGWGAEELADIRARLTSYITTLSLFNTGMINSSQVRIEQMLRTFIDEVRAGKREESVVSTQTVDSLSADEKEAWRQLRKELESVGITPALFTQHRAFIVTTLQRAILEEDLGGDITYTVPNSITPVPSKKPSRIAKLLYRITNSRTALVDAARVGDAKLCEKLLERGADPNVEDMLGKVPIPLAAEYGHEAVVKLLLARSDVNPDQPDEFERTPISYASRGGHEAVVKLLLARSDVNPDRKDGGWRTPISYAAEAGHEAIVKLLLARSDVNPNQPDRFGRTPISYASQNGHEAIVKLLLACPNVSVNRKDGLGMNPLMHAVEAGNKDIVRLLLTRSDIDLEARDNKRKTALSIASRKGYEDIKELLRSYNHIN